MEPEGAPRSLEQIEWWSMLEAAAPRPARSRTQRALDEVGPLALVEAVSTWDTHTFDDLLLVVRDAAGGAPGWRIVGKVHVRLPPGEAAAATPADEAGQRGHESRWRVLRIEQRGPIAAAVLDVVAEGRRFIDHLLLLRTAAGWRIAAAAWAPAP